MRSALVAGLALLAGCSYVPLQSHRLDGTPADPVGQPNTLYLQNGEGTAAIVAAWAALEQLAEGASRESTAERAPEYGPCGPACGPVRRTLP